MKCRACKNSANKFLSLGKMPLVNSFLTKDQISREKKFDLSLSYCPKCFLIQLDKTVPPAQLFRNYIYFSSTSSKFLAHCEDTAEYLINKLKLNKKSLVLEIASNDGAQLKSFKKRGIRILGVDPAKNIAKEANAKSITTIPEFFNYRFAKKLYKDKHIQADLIFGANVLAHVPKIVDFIKGVKIVLNKKGTAVFEFPYIKGLLENKFDTIYHEHVFYYSLSALVNLFKQADLQIYDVDLTEMQGGSLRIYVSFENTYPPSVKVTELLAKEIKDGYQKFSTYKKVSKNIYLLKKKMVILFKKLISENQTIAAYSAPAKGNILLNFFGINNNYLKYIVDKSKAKQGLYTPGTHLLVHSPDLIFRDIPDYLLVLCWNIADEVIGELSEYQKNGGKFIIPVPNIKIIC